MGWNLEEISISQDTVIFLFQHLGLAKPKNGVSEDGNQYCGHNYIPPRAKK